MYLSSITQMTREVPYVCWVTPQCSSVTTPMQGLIAIECRLIEELYTIHFLCIVNSALRDLDVRMREQVRNADRSPYPSN